MPMASAVAICKIIEVLPVWVLTLIELAMSFAANPVGHKERGVSGTFAWAIGSTTATGGDISIWRKADVST